MNLTDAQRETIRYFGLEVVNERECKVGDWILNGGGNLYVATHASTLTSVVVVRPAHAAKVAELERELANERDRCDVTDRTLRDTCDEVTKLQRQVRALGSELAPIMAMKVGSLPWAFSVLASGGMVSDKDGDIWSIKDERLGFMVSRDSYEWVCAEDTQLHGVAPFTLHTEPPPAPTADDFKAAVDDLVTYFEAEDDEVRGLSKRVERLKALAARYRAAKEAGDGR